jgi:hypothetical protein
VEPEEPSWPGGSVLANEVLLQACEKFRIAEPFNSTLHAALHNSANWTKLVSAFAGQFSSIKGLQSGN